MSNPLLPLLAQARGVCALALSFLLLTTGSACARLEAPTAASAPAGTASEAANAQPHIPRKQILETTLSLSAQRPREAREKLERKVRELGGFVQTLNADGVGADVSYQFVVRIPEAKLPQMLTTVRALGAVSNETQEAKDVTREYVDVDARLRNLKRAEERLLGLLSEKSGTLADVIQVEQELTRVRGEAEAFTAQLRALDHDVAMATLTVWVTPAHTAVAMPEDAFSPVRELWADASSVLASSAASLLWALSMAMRAGIAVLPWLPLLALSWFLLRKLRGMYASRPRSRAA